jgi:ribosome-interacting GTPase 1
MPANLSPEYKAAEAAFRKTREPRERLELLREMLRVIPKHKGTERLQADIKARIKALTEELETSRKGGGGHGGPALVVRPEGAAQVAIVGPANSGKSSLFARLTGVHARVAPYPFTTQYPEPGMMSHEDVHLQLLDLPAVSPEHSLPWLAGTLQTADAALLVVDLNEPSCLEQVQSVAAVLKPMRVALTERWSGPVDASDDPFSIRLPTLLVANKADLETDGAADLDTFRELSGLRFPALAMSASTGAGVERLGPWLFENLGIVRVYTKAPGHAADKSRPFTIRRGETVGHVARLIHKDLERSFKYARVWGHSGFDGQHVGHEHVLSDGDIIELHA